MEVIDELLTRPEKCGYLPDRDWRLEYKFVSSLSAEEYLELLKTGWRKYGYGLFRNRCQTCNECLPIRVLAREFQPNRSQARAMKRNADLEVRIEEADIDRDMFDLYMRHHSSRSDEVGWPRPSVNSSISHLSSLLENPFPIQQWNHYLDGKVVAVCYVDPLPNSFSLVYSFYDPEYQERSLGTWMIMSVLEHARQQDCEHVYLGYYIRDCRSMKYKIKFEPNEILVDGAWTRSPDHITG